MAKEILIADSDKADQKGFQRIFETTDYQLVFSENGEDALLRAKLFKPDLIIAGVGLSEKTGLELCEFVKTDSEFKHIPFILLTGMFEEVSKQDLVRVGADGVISKPLREGEILSLVDELLKEKLNGKIEREILSQEKDWRSLSEMDHPQLEGRGEFLLDRFEEEDEEIIELLEVVEEPEPKMSIDDFISPVKAESIGDITPLEPWDKLFEEEKRPVEKLTEEKPLEEKPSEEAFDLSLEEEKETGPRVDLTTEREVSPEQELFEKIELEEILQKVERLQPSIEEEWLDKEIDKRVEEALPGPELETTDKRMELRDFETALKAEMKGKEKIEPTESMEEGLQPFTQPILLEEAREEFEISPELPELLSLPIGTPPTIETLLPVEMLLEEEETLNELPEEEFPESFMEELEEGEISVVEKPPEEKEVGIEIPLEVETLSFIQELEPPSIVQELEPLTVVPELEPPAVVQEVQPSGLISEAEAPKVFLEEVQPQARVFDRKTEELIGKGVQEMMEGFITKVLPEMTQSILNLTMERIEKMVKEVVPEIAEKVIQEEIRRLQKGEKD